MDSKISIGHIFHNSGVHYYYRYAIRDGGNDLAKVRRDQARGDDNDNERNYHSRLCMQSAHP